MSDDEQMATRIFSLAVGEFFQDGMDTPFSQALAAFIETSGLPAVSSLRYLMLSGCIPDEHAAEALRCIGNSDDSPTHCARRELLQLSLAHDSPVVRDAAGLGLAFMDDPRALPFLSGAIRQEKVETIRSGLIQVRTQLTMTAAQRRFQ